MRVFLIGGKGGKPNVCSEHVDFEKCSGFFLSVYVRKRWVNAAELDQYFTNGSYYVLNRFNLFV